MLHSDNETRRTNFCCIQTANGTTITLSETYCSGTALYISMLVQSENPILNTFTDQWGNSIITISTEEKYRFNPNEQVGQMSLDGEFTDDKTYAGVIRIDLNERNVDDSLLVQKAAEAEANKVNEEGAGVESVVKTPFELIVNEKYEEGVPWADYFLVIVDADGKVMDFHIPN